jgi:hypothetical protein
MFSFSSPNVLKHVTYIPKDVTKVLRDLNNFIYYCDDVKLNDGFDLSDTTTSNIVSERGLKWRNNWQKKLHL